MWLYMIGGAIVILAVLGGILLGGVFTIVLIPLALIAAGAALAYSIAARGAQPRADSGSDDQPLPTGQQSPSGHARTTPEGLADARRVQQ
jgi:hypothetical protein